MRSRTAFLDETAVAAVEAGLVAAVTMLSVAEQGDAELAGAMPEAGAGRSPDVFASRVRASRSDVERASTQG